VNIAGILFWVFLFSALVCLAMAFGPVAGMIAFFLAALFAFALA
jgi:hypothetical protein